MTDFHIHTRAGLVATTNAWDIAVRKMLDHWGRGGVAWIIARKAERRAA